MSSIDQKFNHYLNILNEFSDNTDRYKFLINLARRAQPFPEEFRLDNFKVKGCLSQVWLVPKFENGVVNYFSDSDAAIVKGTVTLISDIYSGSSPQDIANNERDLMEALDLGNILSMNRRSGAYNMLVTVKEQAKLFV
ncbi:MAG: SufE family protein [Gammaproteobacteria bacterium]|nr:SufE family protein [Gammaproteobacteria bacterium]